MSKPASPCLLVVDDEPICRRAVADLAVAMGLGCDSAADGLAGLQLARARRYDLLLLDWRMPGMTGSELMLALRADPTAASAASPMVLVTGESIDFERERQRGFNAVLAKPLTSAQLADLLNSAGTVSAMASESTSTLPVLDDAAALAALGGSQALMESLRQMLKAELTVDLRRMPEQLAAAAVPTLRERLHQLTGGARYCGATALASAADQLRQTVKAGLPSAAVWAQFESTARQTIAAIDAGVTS